MFDKFGEMTLEELNKTAEGFRNEGDIVSLKLLAEENGIDPFDFEDYRDGMVETLASSITASMGKLRIQYRDIMSKKKSMYEKAPYKVVYQMVKTMIMNENIATAIMNKKTNFTKIVDTMAEIVKKEKGKEMAACCGTDAQLRKIITTYYLAGEKELEKEIEALFKEDEDEGI